MALKAKAQATTRRHHEDQARVSQVVPPDDVTWGELRGILHEEVSRLPEKLRAAVVLCYWEGRTHEQAGQQLGCATGTVKDRLENTLHKLVCAEKLPLAQAQQEVAADWTKAYVKYVGPLPTGTSQATSQDTVDGTCSATAPVKVSQAGIYHLPGDSSYTRTRAVSCFPTAQDAQAAGFRAPRH